MQNGSLSNTPSLSRLFLSFLRLGATAFGGPAMVAYIRRMVVEQKKWLDEASFRDGVAFCQMVPGATAMQTAAYAGLRLRGVSGAAVSFIGFGVPAFLIMMIFSALYIQTQGISQIISVFIGLQVIVVAIVANATISFGRTTIKDWKGIVIAVIAASLFGLGVSPILVILLAALLGLLLYLKQQAPQINSPAESRSTMRPVLILLAVVIFGFALLFFINRGLFDLATLMFRIDLFAFGGGFASVPLMFHEVVDVRSWIDSPTFLNGIALGQITPGPIVITATFIGYLLYGPLGGLIATVSVFLPSFLIVTAITPYFNRLSGSPPFNKIIKGILCSFVGLLLSVTILFALKIPWDVFRILLVSAAFISLLFKVEIYWVVIIGVVISIIFLQFF
jgi:chromate transporter